MTPDAWALFEPFRTITGPNASNIARHRLIDDVLRNTLAARPDARVVIINRCGHWLQVEHSEEFNRTLLNFLGVSPSC